MIAGIVDAAREKERYEQMVSVRNQYATLVESLNSTIEELRDALDWERGTSADLRDRVVTLESALATAEARGEKAEAILAEAEGALRHIETTARLIIALTKDRDGSIV